MCLLYLYLIPLRLHQPTELPDTEVFAHRHDLSVKKFINTLEALNEHCKPIRKKIIAHFKASASQATTRRSPRKSLSPSKVAIPSGEPMEVETPNRRSSRTTSSLYGTNNSPTKSPLPPPWKKGPIRELPSKDSPKKKSNELHQDSITNDIPDEPLWTPSKKRKTLPAECDSTGAFLAALGNSPSESSAVKSKKRKTLPAECDSTGAFLAALGNSPSESSAVNSPNKSPTVVKVSSPLKRSHAVAVSTSESDESESEDVFPKGRFRPVYLEHRQWSARDPLVDLIWKRAEKLRARPSARRKTR